MERFIADLVKNFESGKLSRREFCETVALAASVYAAGDAANAEPESGFKLIGVNHISYTCPDYAKARDWYTSVLGMESTPGKDNGKRANLMFGPEPAKAASSLLPVPPPRARDRRRRPGRPHLLHDFRLERCARRRRPQGERAARSQHAAAT